MKQVVVQFSCPIVEATRAGLDVTGSTYLRSLGCNVFFDSVPSNRAALGAHSDVNPHAGFTSLHTTSKLHLRFGSAESFQRTAIGTSQVLEDRIDHDKQVIMNSPTVSDWTLAVTGTTAPFGFCSAIPLVGSADRAKRPGQVDFHLYRPSAVADTGAAR